MEILELLKVSGGKWIRKSLKKDFAHIKIDSREIEKNDAFLVIGGAYTYIDDALSRGATTIIIDRDISCRKKINIIKVDSCMQLLSTLAHYNRKKYDTLVIGITGSIGKSTTKNLLYRLLQTKFHVIKNEDFENDWIGVSKTLLKIDDTTDIVLLEMGITHKGDMQTLSCICNPDVALITNIGLSHIGNFKSRQEILSAKLEILTGMRYGVLLLNDDDVLLSQVHVDSSNLLYRVGMKKDTTDICAYNVVSHERGVSFCVQMEDHEYTFKAPTIYMISTILLALQVGLFVGIEEETIEQVINEFGMYGNCLEKIELGTTEMINDTCHVSYESCINAISYISNIKKHKIFILEDILGLGNSEKQIHRKLGKQLHKLKDCQFLLIGKAVKEVYKKNKYKSIWFASAYEALEYIKCIDFKNKLVIVKTSTTTCFDEIKKIIKEQII